MKGWAPCKLGDVLTLHYGKALKSEIRKIGGVPVFSSAGQTGSHDVALIKSHGLIVGRKGTVGKVYRANRPFWCIDTAYYILPDENKYHFDFLFYLLKTLGLEDLNEDSAVPGLNRETAYNQSLSLPPLEEQKSIASVLSSLDDKIDLLHRQNKTLEAMAETLFRQWFVEGAGENWKVRKLGELVTVKRGGSPRPIQDYLSKTGLRWLKISDATCTASPFLFEIKEHIKEEGLKKTTLLKSGTLVLSNSATPGIPKILQVDTCIHDGWLHFPTSHFSNEFLYLLFKKIRPELINQGNGSIFTNLKTDILKEYKIPIPDDASLNKFQISAIPLFKKMLANSIQIHSLEKLRDNLLPKLMSGEIRVA